ncbi:hypothetical protein D9M69_523050 [compost metagenome]
MNANRNGVSTGASAMIAANSAAATAIQSRMRLVSWFSSGAFINKGATRHLGRFAAQVCRKLEAGGLYPLKLRFYWTRARLPMPSDGSPDSASAGFVTLVPPFIPPGQAGSHERIPDRRPGRPFLPRRRR